MKSTVVYLHLFQDYFHMLFLNRYNHASHRFAFRECGVEGAGSGGRSPHSPARLPQNHDEENHGEDLPDHQRRNNCHEQDRFEEGEQQGLDALEIFCWFRQLVLAVKAAHDLGIMHCDLKPSNFILVPNRRRGGAERDEHFDFVGNKYDQYTLKLSDFGVSLQLDDAATHLTEEAPIGTVRYMAPEVVHNSCSDGKLRINRAVDIWSVGVILHQLLHCGVAPHSHVERRGNKFRLLLAIADRHSARVRAVCPRLLAREAVNVEIAQQRHDVLLSLQWVCLQYDWRTRATADYLVVVCEEAWRRFFSTRTDIRSTRTDEACNPPSTAALPLAVVEGGLQRANERERAMEQRARALTAVEGGLHALMEQRARALAAVEGGEPRRSGKQDEDLL